MNRARGATKQPKIPMSVSSEIAPMSGPMYSAPPIELHQLLLQSLSFYLSIYLAPMYSLWLDQFLAMYRGCSSVVERMLCMYEAPSSILGISIHFLASLSKSMLTDLSNPDVRSCYLSGGFHFNFVAHYSTQNLPET